MATKDWPSYLLTIPADLRRELAADAQAQDRSLASLLREILCNHYQVTEYVLPLYGRPEMVETDKMLLRLPPELYEALKAETRDSDGLKATTMRGVILRALYAHYADDAAVRTLLYGDEEKMFRA